MPVAFEVIVVDDCSNDGGVDFLDHLEGRAAFPEIRLIRHPQNRGKGALSAAGWPPRGSWCSSRTQIWSTTRRTMPSCWPQCWRARRRWSTAPVFLGRGMLAGRWECTRPTGWPTSSCLGRPPPCSAPGDRRGYLLQSAGPRLMSAFNLRSERFDSAPRSRPRCCAGAIASSRSPSPIGGRGATTARRSAGRTPSMPGSPLSDTESSSDITASVPTPSPRPAVAGPPRRASRAGRRRPFSLTSPRLVGTRPPAGRLPHHPPANLGVLPMVSDEGTYTIWGVRALHARSLEDWLASLEDGKQPLPAWLHAPFLALFPDRLVAGRLVSVLCAWSTSPARRLRTPAHLPAAGWIAPASTSSRRSACCMTVWPSTTAWSPAGAARPVGGDLLGRAAERRARRPGAGHGPGAADQAVRSRSFWPSSP